MSTEKKGNGPWRLQRSAFLALFEVLISKGYQIVGPTIKDNAIVYDEIVSIEDLPVGWTDEQEAGLYRLKKRRDQALFGYNVGPHSLKKYFHPPVRKLWGAQRKSKNGGFDVINEMKNHKRAAYLGIRACDLNAVLIQDKVFLEQSYIDPVYQAKRRDAFIVAVNCGQAASTCFCASMGTGPKAEKGFDLALTEIIDKSEHYFIIEAGTKKGGDVISALPVTKALEGDNEKVNRILQKTEQSMGRKMDTTDIKSLLYENVDHSQWDDVASRCLTCGNCTMVCPTCFCTTVEDTTDLTGDHAERWQRWDSCFTMDFSWIHNGSARASTKSRYRQWMTHKLASWIDQFDTSGCVGCGRCITWCPVGIDITKEVRTIRETDTR